MINGTLGMVACPILEDELVYNLSADADDKNVFVLKSGFCESVKRKLNGVGIPFRLLDGARFLDEGAALPEGAYNVVVYMMDMGLHKEPDGLSSAIRERLLKFQHHVDAIMLYYGLCGRGLEGIEEWGAENLSVPIAIMKGADGKICDNCVAIPIGGSENYLKLLGKYPDAMFLTPCIACGFEEYLSSTDLTCGGDEMFKRLLDMAEFHKAVKIQTGLGDQSIFQAKAEEFCERYGLELIHLDSDWVTPEVAERTYAEAKGFLSA